MWFSLWFVMPDSQIMNHHNFLAASLTGLVHEVHDLVEQILSKQVAISSESTFLGASYLRAIT